MITPPTKDPKPGELWRFSDGQTQATVRIIEETIAPSRDRRFYAEVVTGPLRGQHGLVFLDQLREKTDEL